jgi:argininosuccinate lyase
MKLWAERFKEETAEEVKEFTASVPFDKRLYRQDIAGSIAHVKMLARQDIIASEEAEAIVRELQAIQQEIERGKFEWRLEHEDVHMNIEAALIERLGEVGGKLHTGRSRNDQIALDMRLYVKMAAGEFVEATVNLQKAILDLAERHLDVVMPGYTHLRRAQPVLFAHYLLAYLWMLERDKSRFADCARRADVSPLGAGALAGSTLPLDPLFVAKELGFAETFRNSVDAVSDRDFVVEFLSDCAILMMHLSRLAEDISLWSSAEFAFIEISDAYSTGSSMMPQKRNPDVAELVRAKTGRVYGHLMAMLTVLKGLPLSYNRDLQEDKEGLFDAARTVLACLEVMAGMLRTIKVNETRMREAAEEGFLLATDLAEYLVRRGMPFREAHRVVGELVRRCLEEGKELRDLRELKELKKFSELFEEDVLGLLSVDASVAARRTPGGTAPEEVKKQIEEARKLLP